MTSADPLFLSLLEDLETALEATGLLEADVLRPGRDPDDIVATAQAAGRQLPSDLVTWYAWHDGEARTGRDYLGPLIPRLHGLDEALAASEELIRTVVPQNDVLVAWDPRWWPLGRYDHAAEFALAIGPPTDASWPPVTEPHIPVDDPPPDGAVLRQEFGSGEPVQQVADSLPAFVHRWWRLLDEGYIGWEPTPPFWRPLRPMPPWQPGYGVLWSFGGMDIPDEPER